MRRAFSIGVFVLVPLAAASAKEVFTPEHVARIKRVTSAVIAPNGNYIAYTLSVPRKIGKEPDGPPWSELHVIRPDGKSYPYVTGRVSVSRIRWTPDGSGISYLAKRGEDKHRCLYVIPVGGGESRRILSHKTDISDYAWSPDGKRVAFLARDEEPKRKKKLAKKGFKAEAYEENLLFTRVWIGRPDADDEPRRLDLEGSASELHWSPAGDLLSVALAPTPLIDDHYMKRRIRLVDVETGKVVLKIDNPGKLGQVAFSPDGKHLAIVSGETIHDPAAGRLMVASTDTGVLRNLLPDFKGHVTSLAWQDNRTIMYLADEGVWTTFNEIDVNGENRKTIVPAGQAVLSRLTLSRDGKTAAMLGQSPTFPNEVFLMAHGDVTPRRMTDSNPWFADMRFARQRVITYKARDGLDIEGMLIEPLDLQPETRYPLILVVHGGPESHYPNGFLTRYASPGQVGAAQGFAVFYPNYRGSTGRGVEFSMMSQAGYAQAEFDDLVDGVDYLIRQGLVDRDRVGVTGGSYGGFATAWCSTYYSERFAAGVMFVGISDHISKSGTTDIPEEMYLVHARKRIWDDWEFFLKQSPIYYVQKARTPLLILHGKNDPRVHPSQSMELYRHLKVLGKVPVRLVWYPGEGHGNRRTAARYDYNLRMMRWFNHYLKSPGGDPPPFELQYGFDLDGKDKPGKEDD
ncbi:MAG: S9 family peptidase, partial [Planctomycetota bacterium]